MFCPKCGAQNIEDAKFCRGCGADISLIPQAMTGELPAKRAVGFDAAGEPYDETGHRIRRERTRKPKEPPRLDKAISNIFMGVGFMVVAFSIMRFFPGGRMWWFWLLLPAFSMLGGGVAEYVRVKQSKGEESQSPGVKSEPALSSPPPMRFSSLPPRNTSELVQPPSVTEGTTRHLDQSPEAPTRHIRVPVEKKAKDA